MSIYANMVQEYKRIQNQMRKIVDLSGKKYGKLYVLRMNARKVNENGELEDITYQCLCDCGNECVVSGKILRTKNHRSCGCLITERSRISRAKRVGLTYKDQACPYRFNLCELSKAGKCCFYCKLKDNCEDKCKNTPEKCRR